MLLVSPIQGELMTRMFYSSSARMENAAASKGSCNFEEIRDRRGTPRSGSHLGCLKVPAMPGASRAAAWAREDVLT